MTVAEKLNKTVAAETISADKNDEKPAFWRRQSHSDLDRSGDFILNNLRSTREEARSRGDSR